MTDSINILIISTSYSEISTGAEAAGSFVNAFIYDLMSIPNIKIRVVYPSVSGMSGSKHEAPFKVKFLPLSLLKISKISHWKPILMTLKAGNDAVLKETKDFKPDHIFALWALPSGYWAMKAAKQYKIEYSLWCLGSDVWSLSKIPIVKNILKKVLFSAQNVFADGYKLCQDVIKISNRDCLFLPSTRNLIDNKLNSVEAKAKFNLCFIGRWHVNKGIDLMLDSLKLLSKDDWSLINQIIIAGGGPLQSIVKNEVLSLKQSGRPITIKGFVDINTATELIKNSDFILIPSRIESIPVVFSDAIQLLRPVVVMPVGDLPMLIKKYACGILARSVSSEDFSQAISQAIRSDMEILKKNLDFTKKEFFIKQKNHIKFIEIIKNSISM